ncbi:MAG: enoyl-CoA hydratase-related protein [Burkholderiaceae bacterium]
MRIADTSVRLSTGFVKMGLPGDFGGHYFLPRIVGISKARELYLTSPMIDATEALRIGLVNKVLEPGDLLPGVREMAEAIASGPRTALA